MAINISLPEQDDLKPKIMVCGVGGAGGNAVNNMMRSELKGVQFVSANTDMQALEHSLAPKKIRLGLELTKGLGAGSYPDVGHSAAEESVPEIEEMLRDIHMLFITAGMGGGTGTGAAPVIAKTARKMGVLTVGVVTKPFHFEGARRMRIAEEGLKQLTENVDTLIVIPNQNLFRIANEKTTFVDAFQMADEVLHFGVRSVTDLIIMPGLINLDFADIRTIMKEMGNAMMGTGESSDENDRAIAAAELAISNPLLDISLKGAKGVLINVTGGPDMTLYELDAAANRIREEVDKEANIIVGSAFDENAKGKIKVSVVATGIETKNQSVFENTNLHVTKSTEKKLSSESIKKASNADFGSLFANFSDNKEEQEDKKNINEIFETTPASSNKDENNNDFLSSSTKNPSPLTSHTATDLASLYEAIKHKNNYNDNYNEPPATYLKETSNNKIFDEFAEPSSNNNSTPYPNKPIEAKESTPSSINNEQNRKDFFDIPAFLRKIGGKK